MKTIKLLLLALVVLSSCKKSEIQPIKITSTVDQFPITNYTLVIVANSKHKEKDTLVVSVNGIEKIRKLQGSIADSYSLPIKTGDHLTINYNPGVVLWNNNYIVDENNLQLFLNNDQYYETKCRCNLNFDKIIQ